jgi:hypothetical protein
MRRKTHGIEFRADRGRWGYRIRLQGRSYKRYLWATKEEAKDALSKLKAELADKQPESFRVPRSW